jgi:hypothetical protein
MNFQESMASRRGQEALRSPKVKHDFEIRESFKHMSLAAEYKDSDGSVTHIHNEEATGPAGIGASFNPAGSLPQADKDYQHRLDIARSKKEICLTSPFPLNEFDQPGHTYRGEGLMPETETMGKLVLDPISKARKEGI